jgi:hypothetical protein
LRTVRAGPPFCQDRLTHIHVLRLFSFNLRYVCASSKCFETDFGHLK